MQKHAEYLLGSFTTSNNKNRVRCSKQRLYQLLDKGPVLKILNSIFIVLANEKNPIFSCTFDV